MKFSIRLAKQAEAGVLAHHRAQMWIDMGMLLPAEYQHMVQFATDVIATEMHSGLYIGWVAEGESEIIGGCGIALRKTQPRPNRASHASDEYTQPLVLNVFVEPTYRSHGVARAMMETLLEHCRAQGYPSVVLHASAAGRSLYESLGFVSTNEMRLDL